MQQTRLQLRSQHVDESELAFGSSFDGIKVAVYGLVCCAASVTCIGRHAHKANHSIMMKVGQDCSSSSGGGGESSHADLPLMSMSLSTQPEQEGRGGKEGGEGEKR